MYTNYFSYKVKVRALAFETKDGRVFENTAKISFFDENKKELEYIEAPYIDTEEIYRKIDNGEDILIDGCYIENFSLSGYRKSRKLEPDSLVEIKNWSAKETIFDSNYITDLSFGKFMEGEKSFFKALFINGKVNFNSSVFLGGRTDFSYVFFDNGNVDFSNCEFREGGVSFKNAKFKTGLKIFQYTNFGNGEVLFVNTEFGDGDVDFINSDFSQGDISFKVARFGCGKIDFHFSTFGKGDISFERVEFGEGKTDFRKVEFGTGKVNFNRSDFGQGDVSFEASQLTKGRLTFKKTMFGEGAFNFEMAEFDNADLLFEKVNFGSTSVSFSRSRFKKLSLKSCHLNHYFDLKVSYAKFIDLSDTIARDIVDFQPVKGEDVDVDCLDISGMRLIGRMDLDWEDNKVEAIIANQDYSSFREKAEQFRTLKENFSSIGQYNYEDKAYIQFKRYEQKADFYESLKKNKASAIWQYPLNIFKTIVFDKMGLYATSPARVLSSLILIYVFFSFIHLVSPYLLDTSINCIPDDTGFFDRALSTFYYSIITFTTVGYGDCSPVGFLRIVASIEGFIGPFMMSYFTVAFARKILR